MNLLKVLETWCILLHLETERIRYKNSRYQLDFGKTRFAFLYGIACFCVDRIVSHCLMATIRGLQVQRCLFRRNPLIQIYITFHLF